MSAPDRIAARALVAAAAFALAACESAELAAVGPSCTIDAPDASIVLAFGDSARVPAAGVCAGGGSAALRWASTAPAIASVDSLSGTVVARAPGAATLVATLAASPSVRREFPVTVLARPCASVSSVAITPGDLSLVVGAVGQLAATVRVGCDSVAQGVIWISGDTSRVIVDSTGRVLGQRFGATTVTAVARANTALRATVFVTVGATGAVHGLTVTPRALTLGALDTARVRAVVTLAPEVPAGTSTRVSFRSRDSCAVLVDSTGLVTALGAAAATDVIVSADAQPMVTQIVRVTLGPPPRGPALFIQSLTGDPSALRGVVTLTAAVRRQGIPGAGRVDLRLAGRVVATAPLARITPGEQTTLVSLTVNTAGRDSANVPLFANGAQSLEVAVSSNGVPVVAGCPAPPVGVWAFVALPVTLANP